MPSTNNRPLEVFLCHAHGDAVAVHPFGGRVGGGFRYEIQYAPLLDLTQPPPYRDHDRLTKDGVD